jgi:hypothetical protein
MLVPVSILVEVFRAARSRIGKQPEHFTDHPELHTLGLPCEPQSTCDESPYQQIGPERIVYLGNYFIHVVIFAVGDNLPYRDERIKMRRANLKQILQIAIRTRMFFFFQSYENVPTMDRQREVDDIMLTRYAFVSY